MTVYPPSSYACVTVSHAHGGCGQPHSRPVVHGVPVHPWALTCPQCEEHLRKDPAWSTTISEIRETYDEKLEREDWEKRGDHDLRFVEAIAAARNAGMQVPDSLARALQNSTGARLFAVAGKLICTNGHDCEPGSKFCPDCGASMRQSQVRACPDGHPVGDTARFCAECGASVVAAIEPPAPPAVPLNGVRKKPLKDMRLTDLQAKAREKGLDDTGTRADLLARLRAA